MSVQQPQAISGLGHKLSMEVDSKFTLNLEGAAATTAPAHSSSRRAPLGTALKTCTHQAVSMLFGALLRRMRILAILDDMSTVCKCRCVCNLAVLDNTSKVSLLERVCDGHSLTIFCPNATVCCCAFVEQVTGQKTCGMCMRFCQYWPVLWQSLRCTVVR